MSYDFLKSGNQSVYKILNLGWFQTNTSMSSIGSFTTHLDNSRQVKYEYDRCLTVSSECRWTVRNRFRIGCEWKCKDFKPVRNKQSGRIFGITSNNLIQHVNIVMHKMYGCTVLFGLIEYVCSYIPKNILFICK